MYKIDSIIESGVRVRGSFQKKNPNFVGRLGSGPHVVGRLGSGIRVSASFKNVPPRGSVRVTTPYVGRLGLGIQVSASFQILL